MKATKMKAADVRVPMAGWRRMLAWWPGNATRGKRRAHRRDGYEARHRIKQREQR